MDIESHSVDKWHVSVLHNHHGRRWVLQRIRSWDVRNHSPKTSSGIFAWTLPISIQCLLAKSRTATILCFRSGSRQAKICLEYLETPTHYNVVSGSPSNRQPLRSGVEASSRLKVDALECRRGFAMKYCGRMLEISTIRRRKY